MVIEPPLLTSLLPVSQDLQGRRAATAETHFSGQHPDYIFLLSTSTFAPLLLVKVQVSHPYKF